MYVFLHSLYINKLYITTDIFINKMQFCIYELKPVFEEMFIDVCHRV